MPKAFLARHRPAFVLLLTGSVALVGAQQVLGTAADAQITTEAIADSHDFHLLPDAQLTLSQTTTVQAAASTGQFEDIVRPTPVPSMAPTSEPAPTRQPTPKPTPEPAPKTLFQSGIASTYGEGDGFEGNRTACGQVFHTNVVQVAHKSLPCGTIVEVEDSDSGRTVEAEVTDRGPYVPGRIVDLSWAAFEELDPTGPGLLHVNVYLKDQ